jgi:hypothetical protein
VLATRWARLSSAATPTAAAKLAHLFFEPLNPLGQPVEALVDPLPVARFVLAAPGAARVRASLVPASALPGATLRAASLAPVSPAAHKRTSRSVFVRLEERLFTQ